MKVCPIQKYGMPAVMEHYVETGGSGQGDRQPGRLRCRIKGTSVQASCPSLTEFFKMPQGRAEDWLLLEFRDKLQETAGDPNVNQDLMWTDFRTRVEKSLGAQTTMVDGGMDRGI